MPNTIPNCSRSMALSMKVDLDYIDSVNGNHLFSGNRADGKFITGMIDTQSTLNGGGEW